MFDFLKDVVSKVPDYGHSDATGDDRTAPKRRLVQLMSWLKIFFLLFVFCLPWVDAVAGYSL